ncbi:MAG: hypothetical protein ACI4VL_03585 [Bacilli bacterium]
MTCSTCENLNEDKKLDGKVSGRKYYCNKNKCFVGGNDFCDKYHYSFRNTDKCNEIYNEGIQFYNDTRSVGYYLIILIIVAITFIIARFSSPELFPF